MTGPGLSTNYVGEPLSPSEAEAITAARLGSAALARAVLQYAVSNRTNVGDLSFGQARARLVNMGLSASAPIVPKAGAIRVQGKNRGSARADGAAAAAQGVSARANPYKLGSNLSQVWARGHRLGAG